MKMKYRPKLEEYFQSLYTRFEIWDEPYDILMINRAAKKNPASKAVNPRRDKPYFHYWSNEHAGLGSITLKYPGVIHFEDWIFGGEDLVVFGMEKGIIPLEQLTYEKKETDAHNN